MLSKKQTKEPVIKRAYLLCLKAAMIQRVSKLSEVDINPYPNYFIFNVTQLARQHPTISEPKELIETMQAEAGQALRAAAKQALPEIKNYLANRPADNPMQTKLLAFAISSLSYRGLKLFREDALLNKALLQFEQQVQLFAKHELPNSEFDGEIVAGLLTLFRDVITRERTVINDGLSAIIFRQLMHLLSNTAIPKLRRHGLITVNMLVIREAFDLSSIAALHVEAKHIGRLRENLLDWDEITGDKLTRHAYAVFSLAETIGKAYQRQSRPFLCSLVDEVEIRDAIVCYFFPAGWLKKNQKESYARINQLLDLVEAILFGMQDKSLLEQLTLQPDVILTTDSEKAKSDDHYVAYASAVEVNDYKLRIYKYLGKACYELLQSISTALIDGAPNRVKDVGCIEFALLLRLYQAHAALLKKIVELVQVYYQVKDRIVKDRDIILPQMLVFDFLEEQRTLTVETAEKAAEDIQDLLAYYTNQLDTVTLEIEKMTAAQEAAARALAISIDVVKIEQPCARLKKVVTRSSSRSSMASPVHSDIDDDPEEQRSPTVVSGEDPADNTENILSAAIADLENIESMSCYERAINYATIATVNHQHTMALKFNDTDNIDELRDQFVEAERYYGLALQACAEEESDNILSLRKFITDELAKVTAQQLQFAKVCLRQANFAASRFKFSVALEIYSKTPFLPQTSEQIVVGRARCHAQMGQLELGVKCLHEYIAQSAAVPITIKSQLAMMLLKQRNFAAAEELFEKMPSCYQISYLRAYYKYLSRTKQYRELKQQLNALATSVHANNEDIIYLLASYYVKMGDTTRAKQQFSRLSMDDPEYKTAYAALYARLNQPKVALKMLREVTAAHPYYVAAFVEYAHVLARENNFSRPISVIDDVLRRFPELLWLQLQKVLILIRCGKQEAWNDLLQKLYAQYGHENREVVSYYRQYCTKVRVVPNVESIEDSNKLCALADFMPVEVVSNNSVESNVVLTIDYPLNVLSFLDGMRKVPAELRDTVAECVRCLHADDIDPLQLVEIVCQSIATKRFKAICQQWLRFGVLDRLLNISNLNNLQEFVLTAADNCDKRTQQGLEHRLQSFIQEVVWSYLATKLTPTTSDIYQVTDGIVLLKGIIEDDSRKIVDNLTQRMIVEFRAKAQRHPQKGQQLFSVAPVKHTQIDRISLIL